MGLLIINKDMNIEDFVTYEQAVKLKKVGFNWECNHYYDIRKGIS